MKNYKNIYNRKIILLLSCVVLFLFAGVGIASAEVTCCTCGTAGAVFDPETRATTYTGPLGFVGFACTDGDRTCGHICLNGETSLGVSREEGQTWEDFVSAGENRWARGEVVTCCACSGIYICDDRNANCDGDGGICGELTYTRETGSFIRKSTTRAVESPVASATETEDDDPLFDPTAPAIQIPVPGFIGFSEVKVGSEGESRYIDIPWIGEYFAAIFNWMMAIVGGVATVMVMIGGFIYLTAAGRQGQVQKAKDMITNALIGLLLAVGSYLILYTINPDLVSFKSIRLDIISRQEIEFAELLTTTVDTGSAGTPETETSAMYTSTFADCPLSLMPPISSPTPAQTQTNPRSLEFIEEITAVLGGGSVPEKIVEVAGATVQCGIDLGSCGKTTAVISTIAINGSSAGEECYRNPRSGSCVLRSTVESINQTTLNRLRRLRCCLSDSHESCGPRSSSRQCARNGCENASGCTNDRNEATRQAKEIIEEAEGSGWPADWISQLQPGDEIVVYNGNDSYGSSHSVTFLGWRTPNVRAIIVQSRWGRPTRLSETCLSESCGNEPIVTRITRPQYTAGQ